MSNETIKQDQPLVASVTLTRKKQPELLSAAQYCHIWEIIKQQPAARTYGMNHCLLKLIQEDYEFLIDTDKELLQKLKKLPTFDPRSIFFPHIWNIKAKGLKKIPNFYSIWDPQKENIPCIITINKISFSLQALPNGGIGINRQDHQSSHSWGSIKQLADMIHECVSVYPKALVLINAEIPDIKQLICYLYAYQAIQIQLADQALSEPPPITDLHIQNQGKKIDPSTLTAEIDTTVQQIIEKDEGLRIRLQHHASPASYTM